MELMLFYLCTLYSSIRLKKEKRNETTVTAAATLQIKNYRHSAKLSHGNGQQRKIT